VDIRGRGPAPRSHHGRRSAADAVEPAPERARVRLAKPPTLDTQDWSFTRPWTAPRRAGDDAALAQIGADYLSGLKLSIETQEALSTRLFDRPVAQVLLLHANEVGATRWPARFDWLAATDHRFVDADAALTDPALSEPHDYLGEYGPGLWSSTRSGSSVEPRSHCSATRSRADCTAPRCPRAGASH